MGGMEPGVVLAGLIAYALAVVASATLVFLTYRFNAFVTSRLDEERLLLAGHRSIAVAFGAVLLSQALLLRHAVFPTMVVVRELLVERPAAAATLVALGQCALMFALVAAVAVGSVALAGWLFTRLTGRLAEHEEIRRDNVAVAIFYAFVLLAITVILDQGVEDLARSLIPYGRSGFVHLP